MIYIHFPADDYHPHYPSKDNDLQERIMRHAARMGCTSLLMCRQYTQEEIEIAIEDHQRRSLATAGKKQAR